MRFPLEKARPKAGIDCLEEAEYGRTASERYEMDGKNGQRMCSADRYGELCPCGALYPAPLARPFFKGLFRWWDGGILLS